MFILLFLFLSVMKLMKAAMRRLTEDARVQIESQNQLHPPSIENCFMVIAIPLHDPNKRRHFQALNLEM